MKSLIIKITIICFLLCYQISVAKCTRKAVVKYQQEYGWSKNYTVDVTFMTGFELNQATNSVKYGIPSVYAIIFWGEGKATVIKLTSYLLCGYEVTSECIDNSIYDLQGNDQDGDKWNICLSGICY